MSDENEQLKIIIDKIKSENPLAKYCTQGILMQWAKKIQDKEYDDYKTPPNNLNDDIEIDIADSSSDNSDDQYSSITTENEYGDVVTVKGKTFIVCNGLVVPQELLDKTIIPMIEAKMNEYGIEVDDVHKALLEEDM